MGDDPGLSQQLWERTGHLLRTQGQKGPGSVGWSQQGRLACTEPATPLLGGLRPSPREALHTLSRRRRRVWAKAAGGREPDGRVASCGGSPAAATHAPARRTAPGDSLSKLPPAPSPPGPCGGRAGGQKQLPVPQGQRVEGHPESDTQGPQSYSRVGVSRDVWVQALNLDLRNTFCGPQINGYNLKQERGGKDVRVSHRQKARRHTPLSPGWHRTRCWSHARWAHVGKGSVPQCAITVPDLARWAHPQLAAAHQIRT